MNLKISNYRGISTAEISLNSITIISGPNGGGKTSCAEALGALLTGESVPVKNVKKTSAGVLVRSGTAAGSATLTGDNGNTVINWPASTVKTEGQPPTASMFATGLRNIIDMPEKERIQTLTDYLKARPGKDDLVDKLKNLIPSEVSDRLWQLIQDVGWDAAYSQVKEKGAKYKGQWEQVTNDNYGSKKAESWLPDGYDPSLSGASETNLAACVTDANDHLELAIASFAIDDVERQRFEELAALLPERQAELDRLQSQEIDKTTLADLKNQVTDADRTIAAAKKRRDEAVSFRDNLPQPKQPCGVSCPHCNKLVEIAGGVLKKVGGLSDIEIQSRKNTISQAQASIDDLNSQIIEYEEILTGLQSKHGEEDQRVLELSYAKAEDVQAAKAKLQESTAAATKLDQPAGTGPGMSVDDARSTLALAQKRLDAFKRKTQADDIHGSICLNKQIQDVISPDGIRSDILAKALKGFNDIMRKLTITGNWPAVELTGEFLPTYRGTPYYLCSKAEQWQTEQVIKLALAQIDRSAAVIIDDAERIVSRDAKGGLMQMLVGIGIPAMVLMAYPDKESAPKSRGDITAYWIEAGIVG